MADREKLPDTLPARMTSKLSPLDDEKPPIIEPVSLPPKLAEPVTSRTSYSVPGVVPPISIFSFELVASCRSPVIDRVPAAFLPPGSMVPSFTSDEAVVPTIIVPLPDKVPVLALVKPAVLLKAAPEATLIVPD